MKSYADTHLSQSYPDRIEPDRFEVGCEGQLIDRFPTAAEALRFARSWAEFTACPYEIFDAATHTCLAIVDPPKEAA